MTNRQHYQNSFSVDQLHHRDTYKRPHHLACPVHHILHPYICPCLARLTFHALPAYTNEPYSIGILTSPYPPSLFLNYPFPHPPSPSETLLPATPAPFFHPPPVPLSSTYHHPTAPKAPSHLYIPHQSPQPSSSQNTRTSR